MIKKAVICMTIFTTLCILVTFGLIFYKTNLASQDSIWHNDASRNSNNGIDPEGYYDQNDLILTDEEVTYKEDTYTLKFISGLKDKKIQSEINQKISNEFFKLIDEFDDGKELNFYMYSQGNFQNILSLCFYISDEDYEKSKTTTLNIDLATGNEFSFEDVFTEDANLFNIVKNSLWKNLSINAYYEEADKYYEQDIYEFDIVANVSEEELYETTKKFLSVKDKAFYVSPQGVTFIYNNTWNTINFKDCYEDIAIYNRYDTAISIFENDDIAAHDLINMSEQSENCENIEYGFVYDNLFMDYCLSYSMFDSCDFDDNETYENLLSIREIIINDAKSKIDEYKSLAKKNPDTMYICFGTYEEIIDYQSVCDDLSKDWTYQLGDICSYTFYESTYKMPMSSYKQKGKADLYDAYQNSHFGTAIKTLYYEGEFIEQENYPEGLEISNYVYEDCPIRIFRISSCKEYCDFFEIIDKDSNYLDAIANEILTSMNDHWDDTLPRVNNEEAYELAKNAKLKLDATGIRIFPEIENLDSYYMFISYDELTTYMIQ